MKASYYEEEILGKAYDRVLMKRLVGYLKPYRILAYLSILLLVAIVLLELVLPILWKKAIDGPISNGNYFIKYSISNGNLFKER